MELAGGVTIKYIGGVSPLLLVVDSCSNNEIVAANYGVLGAIVASSFGRWFMMSIVIFNISSVGHCLTSTTPLLLTPHLVQLSRLVFLSDGNRLLLFILNTRA